MCIRDSLRSHEFSRPRESLHARRSVLQHGLRRSLLVLQHPQLHQWSLDERRGIPGAMFVLYGRLRARGCGAVLWRSSGSNGLCPRLRSEPNGSVQNRFQPDARLHWSEPHIHVRCNESTDRDRVRDAIRQSLRVHHALMLQGGSVMGLFCLQGRAQSYIKTRTLTLNWFVRVHDLQFSRSATIASTVLAPCEPDSNGLTVIQKNFDGQA